AERYQDNTSQGEGRMPMAQARQRVQWYHPGELVLVGYVPADPPPQAQLRADVLRVLSQRVDGVDTRVEATRSFLFPAPGQPTLGFFFVKLTDTASPRAVKDAVESVHARLGPHA